MRKITVNLIEGRNFWWFLDDFLKICQGKQNFPFFVYVLVWQHCWLYTCFTRSTFKLTLFFYAVRNVFCFIKTQIQPFFYACMVCNMFTGSKNQLRVFIWRYVSNESYSRAKSDHNGNTHTQLVFPTGKN